MAKCRIVNQDMQELGCCGVDADPTMSGLVIGRLYRASGGRMWSFQVVNQFCEGRTWDEMVPKTNALFYETAASLRSEGSVVKTPGAACSRASTLVQDEEEGHRSKVAFAYRRLFSGTFALDSDYEKQLAEAAPTTTLTSQKSSSGRRYGTMMMMDKLLRDAEKTDDENAEEVVDQEQLDAPAVEPFKERHRTQILADYEEEELAKAINHENAEEIYTRGASEGWVRQVSDHSRSICVGYQSWTSWLFSPKRDEAR